jgi:hypothetical protein
MVSRTKTDLRTVCIERIEHALFHIEETAERVRFVHSDPRSTSQERESVNRIHRKAEEEFYIQYANVVRVLPIVKAGIELVDRHTNDPPRLTGFEKLMAAVQAAEAEVSCAT